MNIQHYLKYKSLYEALLWTLFIVWQICANVYVALEDTAETHFNRWKPVQWESSSTLTFALLIPLLLIFDGRHPIQFATIKRHLPLHILATIPFCLLHVAGMVTLRKLGYWLMNTDYDFGHWPSELLYEYTKDFRTYFYLLIIVYLYRLVLYRAQGKELPFSRRYRAEFKQVG